MTPTANNLALPVTGYDAHGNITDWNAIAPGCGMNLAYTEKRLRGIARGKRTEQIVNVPGEMGRVQLALGALKGWRAL